VIFPCSGKPVEDYWRDLQVGENQQKKAWTRWCSSSAFFAFHLSLRQAWLDLKCKKAWRYRAQAFFCCRGEKINYIA
jgi:hypothetical protein